MSLTTKVRTFECKVFVTGFLEGGIKDWPPVIQDGVFKALEEMAKEVQLPLTIVHAYCDMAHDDDGKATTPYIHVIASEIVARDIRFTDEAAIKKHFADFVAAQGGVIH